MNANRCFADPETMGKFYIINVSPLPLVFRAGSNLSFLGTLPFLHRLVPHQTLARRSHRLQNLHLGEKLPIRTAQADPRRKLADRFRRQVFVCRRL